MRKTHLKYVFKNQHLILTGINIREETFLKYLVLELGQDGISEDLGRLWERGERHSEKKTEVTSPLCLPWLNSSNLCALCQI